LIALTNRYSLFNFLRRRNYGGKENKQEGSKEVFEENFKEENQHG
jgi:hypothetical protein